MRIFLFILMAFLASSCASSGKIKYTPPSNSYDEPKNVTVVPRSRDAIWQATIPQLGKKFFVINNLDKSSGLINISYSGDPEEYIDCGRILSEVKNASGERRYDFAAAKARQSYEVVDPVYGYFAIDRSMSLEGRINLVFEEVSEGITQITVNTRYIVERKQVIKSLANRFPQTISDKISFNSNNGASFPLGTNSEAAACVATGALEHQILSVVR